MGENRNWLAEGREMPGRDAFLLPSIVIILVAVTRAIIILPPQAYTEVEGPWDRELSSSCLRVTPAAARAKGCVSWHTGIEVISDLM